MSAVYRPDDENSDDRPRHRPAKANAWMENFLRKLIETRSVTKACESVHIARATAYRHRETDDEFRNRWDEAINTCIDDLEASALKRAIEGNPKPLMHKGQPVMVQGPDGKLQPLIVREYETSLTIFMLKALRPKTYFLEKQISMSEDAALENARRISEARRLLEQSVPSPDRQDKLDVDPTDKQREDES